MKLSPRARSSFPQYSPGERRADLGVHVAGLLLAAIAAPLLLVIGIDQSGARAALGLALYAAGLLAMLAFSAGYNMTARARSKEILRRFDRAAIYCMIAGTYSPFALDRIAGAPGIGLFVVLWCLAVLGVVLAFAFPRTSDRVALALYLSMGWSIVIAIGPLVEAVPREVVALLLAGGAVYTLGVAFHLARRLPYHNAVWHGCVLAAAGCHYAAVFSSFALTAA